MAFSPLGRIEEDRKGLPLIHGQPGQVTLIGLMNADKWDFDPPIILNLSICQVRHCGIAASWAECRRLTAECLSSPDCFASMDHNDGYENLVRIKNVILPFVREVLADVEKSPGFQQAASYLKQRRGESKPPAGRIRLSGLVSTAKSLLIPYLQRAAGADGVSHRPDDRLEALRKSAELSSGNWPRSASDDCGWADGGDCPRTFSKGH